jgi:hypothetical protein
LPLYVLCKSKHPYHKWVSEGLEGCVYNSSDSGWMEIPQFQEWFEAIFIRHANTIESPKVLIFDGHRSHKTLEIVELARNNNIHIILLPPHSTHILQSLDVSVFKPVKTEWKKVMMKNNSITNCADVIQKDFPKLLKE